MKKFNFTLGTVLSYKNQVLDSLKNEHAKILARIKQDTSSLEKLKEKKLEVYHKEEQKAEEAFVEEFVSFSRIVAK